jgi:site-specific recombinase XerD
MTFNFLNVYMLTQVGRSPDTVRSYRDCLTIFARFITEVKGLKLDRFSFEECTRDFIFDFLDWLRENGCKPGTRNQRLAVLNSYLKYAADNDVSLYPISFSVGTIPYAKVSKEILRCLDERETAAILSAPPASKPGIRDQMLLILLYDSAMRVSELLNLQVDDIKMDPKNGYLRVVGKGSKERIIPLSELTIAHLQQYMRLFHDAEEPSTNLFYTVIKGHADRMSCGNAERIVQKYADLARKDVSTIPLAVYPHMLRRTRATYLVQHDVRIEVVARLLGHANIATTEAHYAKISPEVIRKAMESTEPEGKSKEEPLWATDEDELKHLYGIR